MIKNKQYCINDSLLSSGLLQNIIYIILKNY